MSAVFGIFHGLNLTKTLLLQLLFRVVVAQRRSNLQSGVIALYACNGFYRRTVRKLSLLPLCSLGASSLSFISKYKQCVFSTRPKTVFNLSCHYMYYERTSEKAKDGRPHFKYLLFDKSRKLQKITGLKVLHFLCLP